MVSIVILSGANFVGSGSVLIQMHRSGLDVDEQEMKANAT